MSDLAIQELSAELREAIQSLRATKGLEEAGIVTRVGDGVAAIYGLRSAGYNEVIEIETRAGGRVTAFALNLLEDEIGAVILGDDSQVVAGAKVTMTGHVLDVPVGPELVGRVVNPLGEPLDGRGPIKTKARGLLERAAPGVWPAKACTSR